MANHDMTFAFNIVNLGFCCFFMLLGTKWFRFASARWVFGTVAELSHPRILHQYSLWLFAPSFSLLLLNWLAFKINEREETGKVVRKKIALVTAILYTMWGCMDTAFPFLSQTLWDFEISKSKSKIAEVQPINVWAVVGWGIIGASGTAVIRNFLYIASVGHNDIFIIVLGNVESVIITIMTLLFLVQFGFPTLFPECCGSRKGYLNVTDNHRLEAPSLIGVV